MSHSGQPRPLCTDNLSSASPFIWRSDLLSRELHNQPPNSAQNIFSPPKNRTLHHCSLMNPPSHHTPPTPASSNGKKEEKRQHKHNVRPSISPHQLPPHDTPLPTTSSQ